MSADLLWCIIRNNNAYLRKKRDIKKPFSAEPGNLTNLSCFKNSGLLGTKSVSIVPAPDNKGFTVVMKKTKGSVARKPAKSEIKVTMKAGPRRSLYKLKNLLRHSRYRRDLTKAALRRASAITRSQKPVKAKKVRAAPKKAD